MDLKVLNCQLNFKFLQENITEIQLYSWKLRGFGVEDLDILLLLLLLLLLRFKDFNWPYL